MLGRSCQDAGLGKTGIDAWGTRVFWGDAGFTIYMLYCNPKQTDY
jgi:hypothetical protein